MPSAPAVDTTYQEAFAGTSDSVVFNPPLRAVFVGGTGNLVVVTAAGQSVTFNSVGAGVLVPVQCQKIMATNTTATNVVGLR